MSINTHLIKNLLTTASVIAVTLGSSQVMAVAKGGISGVNAVSIGSADSVGLEDLSDPGVAVQWNVAGVEVDSFRYSTAGSTLTTLEALSISNIYLNNINPGIFTVSHNTQLEGVVDNIGSNTLPISVNSGKTLSLFGDSGTFAIKSLSGDGALYINGNVTLNTDVTLSDIGVAGGKTATFQGAVGKSGGTLTLAPGSSAVFDGSGTILNSKIAGDALGGTKVDFNNTTTINADIGASGTKHESIKFTGGSSYIANVGADLYAKTIDLGGRTFKATTDVTLDGTTTIAAATLDLGANDLNLTGGVVFSGASKANITVSDDGTNLTSGAININTAGLASFQENSSLTFHVTDSIAVDPGTSRTMTVMTWDATKAQPSPSPEETFPKVENVSGLNNWAVSYNIELGVFKVILTQSGRVPEVNFTNGVTISVSGDTPTINSTVSAPSSGSPTSYPFSSSNLAILKNLPDSERTATVNTYITAFKNATKNKFVEYTQGLDDDGDIQIVATNNTKSRLQSILDSSKIDHANIDVFANATDGSKQQAIIEEVSTLSSDKIEETFERLSNPTTVATASIQSSASGTADAIGSRVMGVSSVGSSSYASANDESGVSAGEEGKKSGVWFSPFYNQTLQKVRKGAAGYKSITTGGSIGIDTKVNDDLILGAAFTTSHSSVLHRNGKFGDETKVDSLLLSVYGMQQITDKLFTYGSATIGENKTRNVARRVSGDSYEVATSKYRSLSYSGNVMVGYNHMTRIANFIPMVGVKASRVGKGSYKETGTTLQNLDVSINGSNKVEVIKKLLPYLTIILIAATPVMAFAETRDIEGNAIIGSESTTNIGAGDTHNAGWINDDSLRYTADGQTLTTPGTESSTIEINDINLNDTSPGVFTVADNVTLSSLTGDTSSNKLPIKINDNKSFSYSATGNANINMTLGNESNWNMSNVFAGYTGIINGSEEGNGIINVMSPVNFYGVIGGDFSISKMVISSIATISTTGTHEINNITIGDGNRLTVFSDDTIIVGDIDGENSSNGKISVVGSSTFRGLLGSTYSISEMEIDNNKTATISMAGTHKIDTITLDNNAVITATEDGTIIEGDIVTSAANKGEIDVRSDLTLKGSIGTSSRSIKEVTLGVQGKTLTTNTANIYANSGVSFTADASLASTNATGVSCLSPVNVTTNNTGTISSAATSVTASFGAIGSSDASLKLLQVDSGANISLAGNSYIKEINIGAQDPTITLGAEVVISQITNAAGKGTLSITGDGATINLGTHEKLKLLELQESASVTGAVSAKNVDVADTKSATFNDVSFTQGTENTTFTGAAIMTGDVSIATSFANSSVGSLIFSGPSSTLDTSGLESLSVVITDNGPLPSVDETYSIVSSANGANVSVSDDLVSLISNSNNKYIKWTLNNGQYIRSNIAESLVA
ncbi:MAG: autotransporter outer membrane beta-barrel domain-containing protein [Rickettsiaceae bacterium]|nr:autotransporter outer membrane beta-barrel domain-containing protein [Rickettsiaceae bacterium]